MRSRSTKIACVLAIAIALAAVAGALVGRWWLWPQAARSSEVDFEKTIADSPEDIERMIRASMAPKYLAAGVDIAKGYKIYHVTSDPARWVFVLADTGPRGSSLLNLYCYQQVEPDSWLLRSYVPIWDHLFPNSLDRELHIQTDHDRATVIFRDVMVFTGASLPSAKK